MDNALALQSYGFVMSHPYLILLLPFVSFLINGLWLGKRNWKAAATLATLCAAASFALSLSLVTEYWSMVKDAAPDARTLIPWEISWLPISTLLQGGADLTVKMGFYLDAISAMMLIVITAISTVVNFYSIGYMKDDPSAGRFFSILSLFSFSMLGLVISSNLVQIYVFWELVGVSSYLLIGFWYQKPSAVAASKKAFIVTRFADAFFLLGILVVAYINKNFNFSVVNSFASAEALQHTLNLGLFSVNLISVAAILVFAGGWGKSALFPLHVWLPDAMEGPTPVSSIIHSATMVVAGVFLTARMFPLFIYSPSAMGVIEFLGAFTALFAAVIAVTQMDIKRILAFSTLSQLGYMLFALGTASTGHAGEYNALGYSSSMFHIFTHAFFKCMLFLSAGAVIHSVHSNHIHDMGGLRKTMPVTYWCTLLACLAIAGVPPLSGFWSKDEILLTALQNHHYLTFSVGLLTGGLTAFYMFRFFFLTFHGEAKADKHAHADHHSKDKGHAHGNSHTHAKSHENFFMTAAIALLAIPTLFAGYLSRHFFPSFVVPPIAACAPEGHHIVWLPYVASLMGIGGTLLALALYGKGKDRVGKGFVWNTVSNKFYIDDLYMWVTHRIIFPVVAAPMKWFDTIIIDGSMDVVGASLRFGGSLVRFFQNGQVQLYMGLSILGLVALYVLGRMPF